VGIAGKKHPFAEADERESVRQRNLAGFVEDDQIIRRQLHKIIETEDGSGRRYGRQPALFSPSTACFRISACIASTCAFQLEYFWASCLAGSFLCSSIRR